MHILITAGPTREYLDSIRFLTNSSSGKMGYAIARAARDAGHRVTLVSGPVALDAPQGVKIVRVETTRQMLAAARKAFASSDAAVFTAAVCDYRPAHRAPRKVPKQTGRVRLILEPTEDIAATLGRKKGSRITIGFALEDHNGRAHAERKLRTKRFDAIVLNDPKNIGADSAAAELLDHRGKWTCWRKSSKTDIAMRIVREIERLSCFPV
jgi:phosphopantothenoylcysteine decarboxylase/phosphopantothenate--cysteine ligase